MNYVSIINLIFTIIGTILSIYLFHFIFFAISGIVHRKKYPIVNEKCRYGVMVSAKDEENVIPRLIDSIRKNNYPQDKIDIFIIAHNCSDKTAEVAASLGVNVIVYNDENAKTLGSAYRYALKQIDIHGYDGFIILNADNILNVDYFSKLNDAFVYFDKDSVVTTFRHALNIKDGVLPALYSYYFATSCLLAFSGRNNLNVSARITGCGFVVPVRLLENGWNYTSITEDIEFSADKIINGEVIRYCDEAVFYDEQPLDIKTMWFQRLRWAKGQIEVSKKTFPKAFKALFDKNRKNKMSIYTVLTFSSFITFLYLFLSLLQYGLLLLSPLFGISYQETFLYWNHEASWFIILFASFNLGALYGLAKSVVVFMLSSYLTVTGVLLASRGKYKGQPKMPLIFAYILFPLFLFLQFPLDLTALLVKEVKWKKIPHGNSKK